MNKLSLHQQDMLKKEAKDTLFYDYIVTCPRCKLMVDQYLFWDDVVAVEIECRCSYVGTADARLIGRCLKPVRGLNNPDIIDPH